LQCTVRSAEKSHREVRGKKMKTIKLSEEEAKRIVKCLEDAARFFGLARISAMKAGHIKDYTMFASLKSEALHNCKVVQKAVDKDD